MADKLFTEEHQNLLFEGVDVDETVKSEFFEKLEGMLTEKIKEKEEELEVKNELVLKEKEDEIIEKHDELFEQFKEQLTEEMEDQISKYLDYVVEEWVKENEIAIESGIKVELMENFLQGMKTLFEENYVEVPEDKVDIVTEAETRAAQLERDLADQIDKYYELKEEVEALNREKVITEMTKDLTESETEKLSTLLEGVEYVDEDTFRKKVKIIKESQFSNDAGKQSSGKTPEKVVTESTDDDNDPMNKYKAFL